MGKYSIRQLSVILENKKGELAKITSILSVEQINIKSLMLVDSTEFGIVRLIVENTDKANQVLIENECAVKENQVFAVKASDEIGSLHQVVAILSRHDIDIQYTYAFREGHAAVFIFKVENSDFNKVIDLLLKNDIELFDNSFAI